MMSTRSVELPRTQAVSERGFLGVSALLFVASTVATVAWCTSMAGVGQMPMPGGWTVSMMWMPMCGQTWLGTAASFLGMWVVMMVAMMLPSLVPMLRGYRHSVRATGAVRLDVLTTLVGLGYFAVWAAFGVVVFAFGAALLALEMRWPMLARAIPALTGIVVLGAGVLQFSAWKAHRLACCREAAGSNRALPIDVRAAWRHGVRLGLRCSGACAGLTAILLATGVMDLRVMAVVAAAITVERLAPGGKAVSRVIGAIATVAGVFLTVQAATLG
ncbi:DUF2182 domain-containing protein [Ralstonia insidiosa]|jgi:predicted metal-binding membrane protein|uniref:DUF2182 domain-containing protein n=1 Tax=Ralstonia TaxID=48736 RepID=UPI000664BF3E|nr:DUF2182 domain-containing protein [Ralstonia insidiosa]KMW48490.1 membrane protein [Ralstonia sp. MD27]MBX3770746.1 DUF2182 domain-containing protein [Ralstonia pickettii]NOZ98345.1 DUF2182 domain-containing protein [Betaproteobacteria bacterium]MBA9854905.1 DUF2182 domain-containing protein [Ralstonia insidiosa]MBA9871034.1 DUF2182 domain-containing protein [Ralstonia insidiosa]